MKISTLLVALLFSGVWIVPASANTEQMKVYRKVYPDLKPSCLYCHIDKTPKKEAGQHDLTAYGLWLQKLMDGNPLTEEIVKQAGRHDEYKPEDAEGVSTDGTAAPEAATEQTQ